MKTGSPIDIAQSLEACRQPLLETGGRSRLIKFPLNGAKTKKWFRVIGEAPDQVFQRLVIQSESFTFSPLPGKTPQESLDPEPLFFDEDDFTNNVDQTDSKLQVDRYEDKLDGCLETISRDARSLIDETGVNMLYLAVGMLEWYQSDASQEPMFAPLILIPVELKKEFSESKRRYIYSIRHNGQELQSNLSLTKRLEDDFGLKLPQLEDGQTPAEYFDGIRQNILSHHPRWEILDAIVVAFFRFQKQLLYLDLDPKNWSNSHGRIDNAQILKIFEGVDRGDSSISSHDENESIDHNEYLQNTLVVLDADSSQHLALSDITAGHDLVIEGPPGTGKSQTIINAIASAIASGKTVLFVAEKLAALTVVYDRMKELGLEDLCLNLHSDQATPKLVFDDLNRRLQAKFSSPHQIESVRQDLLRKQQKLEAYLEATRKIAGPLDQPLHKVFGRVAKLNGQKVPLLRDAGDPSIMRDRFNDSTTALRAISKHITEIGTIRDCVWWGFDCPNLPQADIPLLISHLQLMLTAAEEFSQQSDALDELVGSQVDWFNTLHHVDVSQVQCLHEVSIDVNAKLCQLIADPARSQVAKRLLEQLKEYVQVDAAANAACTSHWSEFENDAKLFASSFRDQFNKPVGSLSTISNLNEWQSRSSQSLSILDRLELATKQLATLGFSQASNLSQAQSITSLYKLISDDRILNSGLISENLLLASTVEEFLRAKDIQQDLNARYVELEKTFAMLDVPETETLSKLRCDLRPYIKCWHRWIWGEFRRTKTELIRFISPTAKRDIEHWVTALDGLEKWQRDVKAFGENDRLSRSLGPVFKGWETKWDVLERLVRWGKTVASKGIDGKRAMEMVSRCEQTLERPHLITLQAILRDLERELSELPSSLFGVGGITDLFQVRFDTLGIQLSHWHNEIGTLIQACSGFRQESSTTLGELNKTALDVSRAAELKCEIDQSNKYRHALPECFFGTQTSIPTLEAALVMIGRLAQLHLPVQVLQWLFNENPVIHAADLHNALDVWMTRRDTWLKKNRGLEAFGTCPIGWIGRWSDAPPKQPPARIRILIAIENTENLSTWIEFCRSRQRCDEIGLSPWIQAAADGSLHPNQLVDSFDLATHDAVARQEAQRDELLRQFSRQEHEQVREEFAELDRKLIQLQREQVRWMAGKRQPPAGISTGRVGQYTQMGLIQHEVTKQRRHCSLRDMVRRAGGALATLKPCWMMSPLSVAQFIEPGALKFHLLIMDEASQIKPADALGSIARAEQVVVVGDPKQMPPSNWMERATNDGLDGDSDGTTLADDNESILEWGESAYRRKRRLKWHYRSQHESLIAFSNEKFYDSELIIFPAPSRRKDQLGLRFHYISDGRWSKRCNLPEAQCVAQAVVRHAHEQPDATIGIATFNAPQMELIQEELDRLLYDDSEARHAVNQLMSNHESLFIKNVENLQGDERDVIFISYTYAPDDAGKLPRFYPINTEKGWRRFNVLVTRARQRIEVFSSMLPEQMPNEPSRPFGVRCMRDYLTYARDGKLIDAGSPTSREPDSDFEIAVADAMRRLGYEVHYQVGVAGYFLDLGVLVPDGGGDYLLGIECDGAAYHSSKSARDRDRLRQEVIEKRGWDLHRIWSTDWFRNQASEEKRLQKAIELLVAKRQLISLD